MPLRSNFRSQPTLQTNVPILSPSEALEILADAAATHAEELENFEDSHHRVGSDEENDYEFPVFTHFKTLGAQPVFEKCATSMQTSSTSFGLCSAKIVDDFIM